MPDAGETNAGAQPGTFIDPYRSYNFQIQIRGVVEGHFTYCSDMCVTVDAISYREGGMQQIVHRLPGQVQYCDITLRYGLSNSRDLFDWMMSGVSGKVDRRTVAIVLLDSDGVAEKLRWNLSNAWPSRWRAAPLDALGREVAIEELTLVYESIVRS
ncbi:MAG TPA: phage tail protein [Terracidiphilus sp.]|jgi:phage tail-like protein